MRSPRLMSGYLGNARATAESFVDGWLKTGDVGTIDRHGRIFVVDRQKVRPPTMAGTLVLTVLTLFSQDLIKGKSRSRTAREGQYIDSGNRSSWLASLTS